MTRIVTALTVILAIAAAMHWQSLHMPAQKPVEKAEGMVRGRIPNGWTKLLSLTDDQKRQIRRIDGEGRAKLADLQDQILKLRQQVRRDQLAVLTQAQRELLTGTTPTTAKPTTPTTKTKDK